MSHAAQAFHTTLHIPCIVTKHNVYIVFRYFPRANMLSNALAMTVPVSEPANSCACNIALFILKLSSIHWAPYICGEANAIHIAAQQVADMCGYNIVQSREGNFGKVASTWKAVAGFNVLYQAVKSLVLHYEEWLFVKSDHLHYLVCDWLCTVLCKLLCFVECLLNWTTKSGCLLITLACSWHSFCTSGWRFFRRAIKLLLHITIRVSSFATVKNAQTAALLPPQHIMHNPLCHYTVTCPYKLRLAKNTHRTTRHRLFTSDQFCSLDRYRYIKKWLTSADTDMTADISCIPNTN